MSDIKPDDLFLIHREGKDYKATVDQFAKDIHINVDACCEDPNDGKLTIKDEDDNVLGEFTANQEGDTEVIIPAGGGDVHWDDIEGKPCIPECSDCMECLEAECRYVGIKDPDELQEWLGPNYGYGYNDECIYIWPPYQTPQDIFDIYIPDGDKNPFCIEAFDHCFIDDQPLHYRLADGTEGTFQTEILKRAEFPDGKVHIRFIPVERDILPKDQAFEVWIDIDEIPDNITCHHPDHDDWVYWDNIVGVPEDLLDQEKHLPSLPRVFDLHDTDLILISRKELTTYHDYAIEARHAKNYFHESVPDFNDGRPHWHIINGPEAIRLKRKLGTNGTDYQAEHHMWDVNGNYLGFLYEIPPNQEVIFSTEERVPRLFYDNRTATFAIGPQTNTSKIVDWTEVFYNCKVWDGAGAEYLDFSSATILSYTFKYCEEFNGDLSKADMSKVTEMIGAFYYCEVFNGDISNWDVSNVEIFNSMLYCNYKFNQDLRRWNTKSAISLGSMIFNVADEWFTSDNSDLSQWCVPHIPERPHWTFADCKGEPVWGTCPRGEDHPDWIDIAK